MNLFTLYYYVCVYVHIFLYDDIRYLKIKIKMINKKFWLRLSLLTYMFDMSMDMSMTCIWTCIYLHIHVHGHVYVHVHGHGYLVYMSMYMYMDMSMDMYICSIDMYMYMQSTCGIHVVDMNTDYFLFMEKEVFFKNKCVNFRKKSKMTQFSSVFFPKKKKDFFLQHKHFLDKHVHGHVYEHVYEHVYVHVYVHVYEHECIRIK